MDLNAEWEWEWETIREEKCPPINDGTTMQNDLDRDTDKKLISSLNMRIAQLEEENEKLRREQTTVKTLENLQMQSHKETLFDLLEENHQLKEKCHQLNTKRIRNESHLQYQRSKLDQLEKSCFDLTEQVEILKKSLAELQVEKTKLEKSSQETALRDL